jgi:hypothetical protein
VESGRAPQGARPLSTPGPVRSHPVASTFIALGSRVAEVRDLDVPLGGKIEVLDHYLTEGPPDFVVTGTVGDRPRSEWRQSGCLGFDVASSGRIVTVRFVEWSAIVDLDSRAVTVEFAGRWAGALGSLLKTALQLFVLDQGVAMVFHSACVERDGGAYVFLGRSGAGKTTAALLSREVGGTIISEEITFVGDFGVSGSLAAYSLPFFERSHPVTGPVWAPLRGVYWLEQAPVDAVVRLDAARGVSCLAQAVSIGVRHPHFMSAALDLAQELERRVPVKLLRFREGTAFWDAIDRDQKEGS